MKSVYVLGNWKANKTIAEATLWVKTFSDNRQGLPEDVVVILCPGYHHLFIFLDGLLSIKLGVQDISQYPSGAYTGEISASMLGEGVSYVLLGHTERRTKFGETNEIVVQKIQQAIAQKIRPIVCVSTMEEVNDIQRHIPEFSTVGMLLYEPLSAIGSGVPDSPENANGFARQCKEIFSVPILYGGSVKPENVASFVKQEFLDGVVVGGASLDPNTFISLVQNASTAHS